MNFKSASYDWLVVAGTKAKFKGVGTVNGAGNYGFLISAADAEVSPTPEDVDTFRIKIWANIAEIELSAMTRQCLDRRIPDLETLRREVTHWYQDCNERQIGVKWQFTSEQARIKLAHLYPEFQLK